MPDDRGNSGFFSINSRDGGNNSTPSSNAPPSNENPLLAYYRQWSSQTPLLSKNLLLIVFIIYLFSFFFPLDLMFSNIPILTLKYFQIYRVVFSSFVGNSILTLLLLLFFFPQLSARMEFASGTFQYFFTIMMLSVVTNVLFVVICVIFSMMGIDSAMYWSCSGIWVVIFALITIDCLRVSFIFFICWQIFRLLKEFYLTNSLLFFFFFAVLRNPKHHDNLCLFPLIFHRNTCH